MRESLSATSCTSEILFAKIRFKVRVKKVGLGMDWMSFMDGPSVHFMVRKGLETTSLSPARSLNFVHFYILVEWASYCQ